MKIEILTTDDQHPINSYLQKFIKDQPKSYSISIVRSVKEVTTGDLLFLVSCNEKVGSHILKNFKKAMVLHASDLPKGRGWSPHIWEIIDGAHEITVTLLDAAEKLDSGDIYKKISINIPTTALWNEINDLLFNAEINLMKFAIENFYRLQKYRQSIDIEASYHRKRTPEDSKIDTDKSIGEQFDLIRVSDPNRFPAFFKYRGETFKIVLEKL